MDDLIILYEKYNKGEYDIVDISRILSYIALPDEMDEDVEEAEYRIENIRFLNSQNEQKGDVNAILVELIEKYKKIKAI